MIIIRTNWGEGNPTYNCSSQIVGFYMENHGDNEISYIHYPVKKTLFFVAGVKD